MSPSRCSTSTTMTRGRRAEGTRTTSGAWKSMRMSRRGVSKPRTTRRAGRWRLPTRQLRTPGRPLDLVVREVADQFRLLSDPTRLQILTRLTDRCHNVGEMCEALGGLSQPAVSHHLALLRVSGLVVPSREGKFNYYDLTDQGRTLTEAVRPVSAPRTGSGAIALFRQASDTTRLQILATLSEGRPQRRRTLLRPGRDEPARRQPPPGPPAARRPGRGEAGREVQLLLAAEGGP